MTPERSLVMAQAIVGSMVILCLLYALTTL